jgi:hypothetical protein
MDEHSKASYRFQITGVAVLANHYKEQREKPKSETLWHAHQCPKFATPICPDFRVPCLGPLA